MSTSQILNRRKKYMEQSVIGDCMTNIYMYVPTGEIWWKES